MLFLPTLIRQCAREHPQAVALVSAERSLSYAALDASADRIAATLQRHGVGLGTPVGICANASIDYIAVLVGVLRAGAVWIPLPQSGSAQALTAMIADAAPRVLFIDSQGAAALRAAEERPSVPSVVALSEALDWAGATRLQHWLLPDGARPDPVTLAPESPFNVIYSSGTTGTPKGIIHAHAFRFANIRRAEAFGYGRSSVTLLSTPLYSNLTLATLIGALGRGGTVILMAKFAPETYLQLAREHRVTHTMLVPVQYQRLLAHGKGAALPRMAKFSTGAPFGAALKAQVLAQWPGELTDIYGMTEGGATCMLEAHRFTNKLHTVGTPMPQHDLRFIDERGAPLTGAGCGEIVGRSAAMMSGYLNRPQATQEVQWQDEAGATYIRTGDLGERDAQGFVILKSRKKDMIISGGFNIYPIDLESVLLEHPEVAEAAVFGVPSERFGESPAACVVLQSGAGIEAAALAAWANARLGRFQRLSALEVVAELPRNAAGKILKRALRAG